MKQTHPLFLLLLNTLPEAVAKTIKKEIYKRHTKGISQMTP